MCEQQSGMAILFGASIQEKTNACPVTPMARRSVNRLDMKGASVFHRE